MNTNGKLKFHNYDRHYIPNLVKMQLVMQLKCPPSNRATIWKQSCWAS